MADLGDISVPFTVRKEPLATPVEDTFTVRVSGKYSVESDTGTWNININGAVDTDFSLAAGDRISITLTGGDKIHIKAAAQNDVLVITY